MDPILGRFLASVSRAPSYPLILEGERVVTREELAESAREASLRIAEWGLFRPIFYVRTSSGIADMSQYGHV